MNDKIKIMPGKGFDKYAEKLEYFEQILNELHKEERYSLPLFLLRCQLIEFSLKYLLSNYPYCMTNRIDRPSESSVKKMTMGQVVGKLRDIKDSHIDDIVIDASDIVKCRNELTHHVIKSKININKLYEKVNKSMKKADKVEQRIFYFFEFVDGFR